MLNQMKKKAIVALIIIITIIAITLILIFSNQNNKINTTTNTNPNTELNTDSNTTPNTDLNADSSIDSNNDPDPDPNNYLASDLTSDSASNNHELTSFENDLIQLEEYLRVGFIEALKDYDDLVKFNESISGLNQKYLNYKNTAPTEFLSDFKTLSESYFDKLFVLTKTIFTMDDFNNIVELANEYNTKILDKLEALFIENDIEYTRSDNRITYNYDTGNSH